MRNDFKIVPMSKIMEEMSEGVLTEEDFGEMKEEMYLLSNHIKLYGAVGMLCTDMLNPFMKSRRIKKLLILPSSVNEVILVPYNSYTRDLDFAGYNLSHVVERFCELINCMLSAYIKNSSLCLRAEN